MNRIDRAFEATRAEGRAALIVFVTAGDPDIETTAALIPELYAAGADAIEIGMPHSDPIGEGPTIQASSLRALAKGITTARVFDMIRRVRQRCDAPLVWMGYLNNVLALGPERFADLASAAGLDGLIVADVPYESTPELDIACEAKGVHHVLLASPTTTPERMLHIARRTRGFLYCVAVTGVTGARRELPVELPQTVARLKRLTSTPIGVGFGVSTPEHVKEIAQFADAAIVGSALVDRIGKAKSPTEALESAVSFVRSLRAALGPATR